MLQILEIVVYTFVVDTRVFVGQNVPEACHRDHPQIFLPRTVLFLVETAKILLERAQFRPNAVSLDQSSPPELVG